MSQREQPKTREEWVTPYSIGEARKAYDGQIKKLLRDRYHQEIIEWLLKQVEAQTRN